jgi:hypothetical protein
VSEPISEPTSDPISEPISELISETNSEPHPVTPPIADINMEEEIPLPDRPIAATADSVGEMETSGSGIRRRGSARRSVSGAPMSKADGVSVVEQGSDPEEEPDEGDEARLGAEIVEDAADEEVGSMTNANSQKTAQFLSEEYNRLKSQMFKLFAEGTNRGYSEAYQGMGMIGRNQPCSFSDAEANRLKNRYGNIMAYDHSRVVLEFANDDPDTTYINANWVDGYNKKRSYIASQGPVPNSFISHWRMIWQEKIETIVMVTHEVEGNRMKCHRCVLCRSLNRVLLIFIHGFALPSDPLHRTLSPPSSGIGPTQRVVHPQRRFSSG